MTPAVDGAQRGAYVGADRAFVRSIPATIEEVVMLRSAHSGFRPLCLAFLAAIFVLAFTETASAQPASISEEALSELEFRAIGPAVTGGRIHDVEALPDDPSTLYVATASGGLWKSTNRGTTWKPIFDDQPVSTFGDLAIAPSNPDIFWAGTGEQNNRQSTSWGNGVYRSTDGGASWAHLGLEDTRHIGRVVVHPENPDVAYVAALGNLWAASETRGVYKTTDGGQTWAKVFSGENDFTGVVDLVMDPIDPNTLYAAAYQRLRRTWGFNGGGPGSGIYKSTDGGATWAELTNGIPGGDKGRIGLAISQTQPDVLYATIEHADDSGTYRSRDAGATWTKVNDLNPRPMYYSHIFVDPTDADRVFVLATEFYMSADGGQTFTQMPTRPTYDVGVHSDHHSLWINPNNPEHLYLAGDAGLHETWDRGQTYRRINNIPIGQFYAIGLDQRAPYNVYGGMQDNHSWMGPSATRRWIGIINDDWKQIGFGDGMYQQVSSPRAAFIGSQNGGLARVDPETGDRVTVEPMEPEGEDYRFDWVTPTLVSRHDSSTVYLGGNRLFISRDRGNSWTHTPDLTKDVDRATLPLMGVPGDAEMLSKHDGTASYGEITTIAESPLTPDVLWVGTDDGNVQVSRDGGQSWTEVGRRIEGVNDTTYVSRVVASAQGVGTAYVTLDAHRDGDLSPYVFKTTDFGQSWTARTNGLPESGSVNALVEHPDNPQVLFLGTEHGLFVTTTAGEAWVPFEANLPTTLYDDLKIHRQTKDLVAGTHGRSLWILDDTTPLANWTAVSDDAPAHLFPVRAATIFHYWKNTSYRGQAAYAGDNPPFGALLHYRLTEPVDSVRLTIRNEEGRAVRSLSGPTTTGPIHRVRWDLRHAPPPTDADGEDFPSGVVPPDTILPAPKHPLELQGPFVRPGIYTATLQAGERTTTQRFRVTADSKIALTDAQWHDREQFLLDVAAMQQRAWGGSQRATAIRDSLQNVRSDQGESDELAARVDTAEAHARRLNRLRRQVYGLAAEFNTSGVTQPSLHPPTDTQRERHRRLQAQLRKAIRAFESANLPR